MELSLMIYARVLLLSSSLFLPLDLDSDSHVVLEESREEISQWEHQEHDLAHMMKEKTLHIERWREPTEM